MTANCSLELTPSQPKLLHGVIQQSYSIDFSQAEASIMGGSFDDDEMNEGSMVMESNKQLETHASEHARSQLHESKSLITPAVKSNKYYHILNARSMSPRPFLATQASMRSAASSPGGLQYPLQDKLRKLSRAQRQELLIRTGAPIPITRSNSLEDGASQSESPTTTTCSSKFLHFLHPHSVVELRRDSSILDRATNATRSRRKSGCCSSDELDHHVIRKSRSKAQRSAMRSLSPSNAPRTSKSNHILLHIYDLITTDTLMQLPFGCICEIGKCFKDLNDGLHLMGTGAYHVGVEVNGIEYAFGACSTPGRSGVFPCTPKRSPGYQYRTTVDFGERAVIRRSNVAVLQHDQNIEFKDNVEYLDGREIIRNLAKEYMGADYDILRKNCCTFARDVCFRFGIEQEEIPGWFSNLAESGAMTQDIARATVEPLKVFSICETDAYEIKMGSGVLCS
ncbi:hypothetical protein MPSEU_000808400 [Mayamaea pseudoterrestris]|nr:hypothetical protein MPSEU_000808400 [Mayamaea pseudoterrestris]